MTHFSTVIKFFGFACFLSAAVTTMVGDMRWMVFIGVGIMLIGLLTEPREV